MYFEAIQFGEKVDPGIMHRVLAGDTDLTLKDEVSIAYCYRVGLLTFTSIKFTPSCIFFIFLPA